MSDRIKIKVKYSVAFDEGETSYELGDVNCENIEEAKVRRDLAARFKQELKDKYEADNFDLDYHLPKVSGLYVKQNRRDVL